MLSEQRAKNNSAGKNKSYITTSIKAQVSGDFQAFLNDLLPCVCIAQGLEESEGRITALISKVRTLENVNTDLNKKITGLDRRGKEQEALHKKQVGEELYKILV
jgi:hypothetical protein